MDNFYYEEYKKYKEYYLILKSSNMNGGKKTSNNLPKSCVKIDNKKYENRPSPPYHANNCKNVVLTGNDKKDYISTSNKNGTYFWKTTEMHLDDSLEYSDWIKYAEKKKLFFGTNDYKKLEHNKRYNITQIDYIKFLSIEYASKFGIKNNKVYDPLTFFNKFKSQIITKNNVNNREGHVLTKKKNEKCCSIKKQPVDYYEVIMDTTKDKSFNYHNTRDFSFFLTEKGWLASGSGDGYSRWMLWENLEKMPKFYFTKQ